MIIIGNLGAIFQNLIVDVKKTIKHRKLTTKRIYDNKIIYKYYTCNTATWNYWLKRYYPKAELILEWTHYIKN